MMVNVPPLPPYKTIIHYITSILLHGNRMKHQSLLPRGIGFLVQIYHHCATMEMQLSFLDMVITILLFDIRTYIQYP